MFVIRQHRRMSGAVKNFYKTKPIFANSCTGFITFAIGDILSQSVTETKRKGYIMADNLDLLRACRTGCFGVFMNGVMLHYWYRCIDKAFGSSMKEIQTVVLKCVTDQIVYAPFSIVAFFSYAAINKGGSTSQVKERFVEKTKESFVNTWVADCSVWPVINAVSFSLVPIHVRPTFVGLAQVGWQTYLSHVGYREIIKDDITEEMDQDDMLLEDSLAAASQILALDVKSTKVKSLF